MDTEYNILLGQSGQSKVRPFVKSNSHKTYRCPVLVCETHPVKPSRGLSVTYCMTENFDEKLTNQLNLSISIHKSITTGTSALPDINARA